MVHRIHGYQPVDEIPHPQTFHLSSSSAFHDLPIQITVYHHDKSHAASQWKNHAREPEESSSKIVHCTWHSHEFSENVHQMVYPATDKSHTMASERQGISTKW